MCRGTLRIRSRTARLVMPCSRRRWTSRSRVRAEVIPMPENRRSGMDAFQPLLYGGERRMACQIDLQGSHGNPTLGDGFEIGSRSGILLRPGGPHPVHRPPARIVGGHDGLGAMAIAEARAAKAP